MLPPTKAGRPLASNIAPTSDVTVVLPALPVIPITGAGQRRRKSRIIAVIGTPAARAAASSGSSSGTPWLANSTSTRDARPG